MKRIIATMIATALVIASFAGCSKKSSTNANADDPNVKSINLWSFTDEVPKMIEKYKATHPEFTYDVKTTIIATTDGAYQPALDQALAAGGPDAPDMYCAESAFVLKYTKGDASKYAAA